MTAGHERGLDGPLVAGVDVGGTKISVVVTDCRDRILYEHVAPTDQSSLVGPVAAFGDDWLAEVRRYARSSVLALLARDTQIEFGHVHDDVVVLGASALLMEQQLGLALVR